MEAISERQRGDGKEKILKKEKSEVDKRIEKYDKKVRIRGEIVEDKR